MPEPERPPAPAPLPTGAYAPPAPLPTLDIQTTHWTPDRADITTHGGAVITPDMRFVAPPPPEIGTVLTAYTPLRVGERAKTLGKRIGAAFFGALLAVGLVWYILARIAHLYLDWPLDIPIAIVGAVIGWFVGKPRLTTSYVGERGIAEFQFDQAQGRIAKDNILSFTQATALRVATTNRYTNGVYNGTNYEYKWYDASGKQIYKVSGTHNSKNGDPPLTHAYWFGRSAEIAWSNYMLPLVLHQLGEGQPIRFPLSGSDYVQVDGDGIALQLKNKSERLSRADYGGMSIRTGTVTVQRKDAKAGVLGIGRSGYFSFPYASLANGRLFLFLMAHLSPDEQVDE